MNSVIILNVGIKPIDCISKQYCIHTKTYRLIQTDHCPTDESPTNFKIITDSPILSQQQLHVVKQPNSLSNNNKKQYQQYQIFTSSAKIYLVTKFHHEKSRSFVHHMIRMWQGDPCSLLSRNHAPDIYHEPQANTRKILAVFIT